MTHVLDVLVVVVVIVIIVGIVSLSVVEQEQRVWSTNDGMMKKGPKMRHGMEGGCRTYPSTSSKLASSR